MNGDCDYCRSPLNSQGLCPDPDCESHSASGTVGASGATASVLEDDIAVYSDAGVQSLETAWKAAQNGASRRSFMTMCGFPTAGKSWTAERVMRKMTGIGRKWGITYDPKAPRPSKDEEAAGVLKLEGTQEVLVHGLGRGPDLPSLSIIDLPGEFFSNLAGARDDDEAGEKPVPVSLIAAIAISDRLLFTIPADVCVLGELQGLRNASLGGNARELLSRATEMRRRDAPELEKQRHQLYDDWKEIQKDSSKSQAEVDAVFTDFSDTSISLYETTVLNQAVDLRTLATKLGAIFGRAAFLVQKYGRGQFFDTDPEEWFKDYVPSAATDLPRLRTRTFVALTKSDRLLPLVSDKYRQKGLPPSQIWDDLPERVEFRERLDEHGWTEKLRAGLGDPRLAMAMVHPRLVGQIDYWLPFARFEWVSADWQAGDWSDLLVIDNDDAGIREIADWIEGRDQPGKFSREIRREVDRLRARIEGHDHHDRGIA